MWIIVTTEVISLIMPRIMVITENYCIFILKFDAPILSSYSEEIHANRRNLPDLKMTCNETDITFYVLLGLPVYVWEMGDCYDRRFIPLLRRYQSSDIL